MKETTGWLVYRCEVHHRTTYVNANPRQPTPEEIAAHPGEDPHPSPSFCCHQAMMVDVVDQHEFCEALRELQFPPSA